MLDVSTFSFQPRRLWRLVRVSATVNDSGDLIAKFFPDIAQSFCAATIFNSVVKKRGDRFRFIRTVLKRDGSHAKNMRHIRNPRFLPHLITMRLRRINQPFLKSLRQLHSTISIYAASVATAEPAHRGRSAKKHSVRTLARIVGIRSRNMTVSFRGLICCPSITFLKSLAVP